MKRKSFKSDAFIFTPTAMSLAMGRAGSDRPTQFARVPKAMEVHADGKRVVVEPVAKSTPGAFGKAFRVNELHQPA